ncbi:hypothetical protein ES705_39487 [subsurface metagenome]
MITYDPSYDCVNLPLAAFCAIYGLEGVDWLFSTVDEVEWPQPIYLHLN